MIFKITGVPLSGEIKIPSSKSISHRAVIAASLASGISHLEGVLESVDLTATVEGLKAFGVQIEKTNQVTVSGGLKGLGGTVDCHESGSTIRFLIPISLLTEQTYHFVGKGKLVERPLGLYSDLFQEKGISYHYDGKLPFTCKGPIKNGLFKIRGDISSQFITGLLYTLPLLDGDSVIEITHVFESKPYVDLTLEMLSHFGIVIQETEKGYYVPGNQTYQATDLTVEGDYSQSAFWIVAGLLKGNLQLSNLRLNSKQGDKAIVDIAKAMGGRLEENEDGILVSESQTHGTLIDASQIPDLVPILAVLASVSKGETRIFNAERVRIKESDRLLAIATELKKMGALIEERPDGLVIQGVERLVGAEVDAWNDHRIAMALTIASLKADGTVVLSGAESVSKSYPHFFEDFKSLGGQVHE
jgi:3-phosphoshikimate 1-carboxyvinyltransferase